MIDTDFVQLVATMRKAQKAYFRDRTPESLQQSKWLEHEVDRAIKLLTGPKAEPSLFDKMR